MLNKTHFWSDKECYTALYIIYLFSVNYGKVWQKRIKHIIHIIFSVDLMIANDISANKSICYCTL